MNTLNLYGVEVQVLDYPRLKLLADIIIGYTFVDLPVKKARKASVYKAAAIILDLKSWARDLTP